MEPLSARLTQRADELFAAWQDKTFRRTDRMFAGLMAMQFLAGIAVALWISPRAWAGETSSVHLHVWAAVVLGGLLSGFPILLALTHGGTALTRHTIAVGQMLTSALLIHLTGGRIETHFHVFGSLAFLAFYRDWRVLVTASAVVAVDHFLRGVFWPQSVFGVLSAPVWRAAEHAGWVVFEDFFLVIACREMLSRVRESVTREAQLEATNEQIHSLNQDLQQHAREINAANRELTDFAYVVSHDLKAPLRGIGSLSNWLAADYADKLDDAGREQLSLMTIRVKRLNALVDGILAYSRAGRSREDRVPVNLDAIVKNVAEMLAPPLHIRIEFETSLPTVVFELTKAQQLFQNLLGNAIKYMDKPQGRIRVRCDARNGDWEFAVADNGPGIEAKYFEKVFQLFQTLAPRDEVEGTGVGLALTKKIVESEGGRVWIESTPGAGATFRFTLPRS